MNLVDLLIETLADSSSIPLESQIGINSHVAATTDDLSDDLT